VVCAQQALNITLRDHNVSHGFASVSADPGRVAAAQLNGRNLEKDLRREVHSGTTMSASVLPVEKPKYSTPDKTLRATQAVAEELDHLLGVALIKQQARVKELLAIATKQTADVTRNKTGA
jgi:hypothetical protein